MIFRLLPVSDIAFAMLTTFSMVAVAAMLVWVDELFWAGLIFGSGFAYSSIDLASAVWLLRRSAR